MNYEYIKTYIENVIIDLLLDAGVRRDELSVSEDADISMATYALAHRIEFAISQAKGGLK